MNKAGTQKNNLGMSDERYDADKDMSVLTMKRSSVYFDIIFFGITRRFVRCCSLIPNIAERAMESR